MGAVEDYAAAIRAETPPRLRSGTVAEVIDATHVRVSLGDRSIAAYGSAPVGSLVTVVTRDNLSEILTPPSTAWATPTLTGSWVNHGAGVAPASYRRTGMHVELQGAIKSGTLAVTAFTLPVGFRPAAIHVFSVSCESGTARLDVTTDGSVIVRSYSGSGSNALVSLSGIRFPLA